MMSDEPKTEAEFLERESRLAKESLAHVRGEILESLSRTADVSAWTQRYPWPALGTAAVAGVTTGWGMGRMLWRSRKPTQAAATAESASANSYAAPSSRATSATASLLGSLGTLASAMASAVAVAAAEAVKDVVKEKVHETLNPTPDYDSSGESPSNAATDDA
jgi:hypothetical protein